MARTLDQIFAALDPGYAGSRQLVQDKVNALPGQADAEISGLDAKLQNANTGIVDAARRRGLGFSGIPIAEQAQYAATEYAPAIARVRDNVRNQQMSLQEALLGMAREQRTQAEGIYNNEMARDLQERQLAEQIRQFNEKLAFDREQAARAAAANATSPYNFPTNNGVDPAPQAVNPIKVQAQKAVQGMLSRRSDPSFYREVVAISKSAGYGNALDQAKLELLRAAQPGLFQGGNVNMNRINALLGGGGKSGGW